MDSTHSDIRSPEAGYVWIDTHPSTSNNRVPIETAACRERSAAPSSDDERYDPIDVENLDPDSEAFYDHEAHLRRTSIKRPVATSGIAADAEHGDRNLDSSSRGAPRRKVKSPLPDNYPRIPLNDITAVLYADSNVAGSPENRCKKGPAGSNGNLPPGNRKATGGKMEYRYQSTGSVGELSQQQPMGNQESERKMTEGGNGRLQTRPTGSSRNVLSMR